MKKKREKKKEIDKKKISDKKQIISKEKIEDIEKPRFNFNLVTGIMIFILLIGASFSISPIFGVAFLLSFFISFYNKILEKKPFMPLILFLGAFLIKIGIILFLPSVFKTEIYLDLIISLIVLIVIFLMSFKIRK